MVLEINYEQYKTFCGYLPCKDVFYFLDNLFVKFPKDDNIYAIKSDVHSNPEFVYENILRTGKLVENTLNEFLMGLPTSENGTYIKDELYRGKSILVKL